MKNTFYKILNGLFSLCNKIIIFCVKYPALVIFIIAIIAISILILLLNNNVNVGGLFGKALQLFGIKQNTDNVGKANTIPKDRKQAIREADANGYAQHKVDQLESSLNPFRDKTKVTLPDGKIINLPEGIKDTDVELIIEAESEIIVIPYESNYQKALDTQKVIENASSVNSNAKQLLERLKQKNG